MEAELTRAVPLQRYGQIEEIGNATLFLCSDAAAFVNGATLVVDGAQWHNATVAKEFYPDMFTSDINFRDMISKL